MDTTKEGTQHARPTPAPTDIVRRVREGLKTKDFGTIPTQEEFASMLGCSLGAVQKMEQQQRLPGKLLRPKFLELAKRAGIEIEQ